MVTDFKINELTAFLQYKYGSSILPFSLPLKVMATFLGGCKAGCHCKPTVSTCDLRVTIPLHCLIYEDMKEILLCDINDSSDLIQLYTFQMDWSYHYFFMQTLCIDVTTIDFGYIH